MKAISIDEAGDRIRADFGRAGRPRTKWYDTMREKVISKLLQKASYRITLVRSCLNPN